MTTPLDPGPDPEPPGQRRGLESYPEFFAYPIDPDVHETALIPRIRTGAPLPYQKPYSPPPPAFDDRTGRAAMANTPDAEGTQPTAQPAPAYPDAYPEAYIKDKPSAYSSPVPEPRAPHGSPLPRMPRMPRGQAPAQAANPPSQAPETSTPHTQTTAPAQQPQAPLSQTPPVQPGLSYGQAQAPSTPSHLQAPVAQTLSSRLQVPAPPSQAQPFSAMPQTPAPAPLPQMPPPLAQTQAFSPQPQPEASPLPPPLPAPVPLPPRPPRSRSARKPGRRRAKRSLAATLWPFQAFARPVPAKAQNTAHIRSRSTTATVWRKLRADRAAVLGGCTVVVLILLAVFAPVVTGLFGVTPNALHPELTDATFGPHGGFGGISWAHPLGVDQRMGRDILARLLYGSRVSLLIAGGATLLSVGLGVALGVLSGYLGGRVDLVVMRVADVFLAFPLMLFALGLTGALSDQAFGLSGNALRIAIMIFVMGFFNWPYIARIVRAEVLSLRGREFVDAARAMGASTRWIVGRELLPNLLAPILVYTTLLIPANIVFEAGLSALGIGLNPPASSWGQMLTDAVATVYTDPEYLIVPGMAVFITVLAFNLFGDGLRNATDPTAQ
ncbi:ABC-type dipeptide/oligopeptide/nickel transport system permease subunit [Catenulispora sp. MAP5-51]|uniref:ABC transporter permease n=1 Tax=Catenulispora sp. MAP5-51 TaxID=3156298 RepID=UPI0035134015